MVQWKTDQSVRHGEHAIAPALSTEGSNGMHFTRRHGNDLTRAGDVGGSLVLDLLCPGIGHRDHQPVVIMPGKFVPE